MRPTETGSSSSPAAANIFYPETETGQLRRLTDPKRTLILIETWCF
jgi:hypothetical protein